MRVRFSCAFSRSSSGAVLVEFALVAILLVAIAYGLLAVGRAYSSVGWMVQTSYEAVIAGSESISNLGSHRMKGIEQQFASVMNRYLESYSLDESPYFEIFDGGESVRLVRSEMSGNLEKFSMLGRIGIEAQLVAPHVAYDQGVAQDLSDFATWGGSFDCTGEPCELGSCPTLPCGMSTGGGSGGPSSTPPSIRRVQYEPTRYLDLF